MSKAHWGQLHSGQTTRNDGTLQADSNETPLTRTGRRDGDDAMLQSLNDTEDNRSQGTQQNDEAMAMDVDDEAATDKRRQDGAMVKQREEQQAEEANFQARARLPPSQDQTDSGHAKYMSEQEVVKCANQFQAQGELGNTVRRNSTSNQEEAWSQARHEHPHPDHASESGGSMDSRDYPGAALDRFEPGAQTFPQNNRTRPQQAIQGEMDARCDSRRSNGAI